MDVWKKNAREVIRTRCIFKQGWKRNEINLTFIKHLTLLGSRYRGNTNGKENIIPLHPMSCLSLRHYSTNLSKLQIFFIWKYWNSTLYSLGQTNSKWARSNGRADSTSILEGETSLSAGQEELIFTHDFLPFWGKQMPSLVKKSNGSQKRKPQPFIRTIIWKTSPILETIHVTNLWTVFYPPRVQLFKQEHSKVIKVLQQNFVGQFLTFIMFYFHRFILDFLFILITKVMRNTRAKI